MALTKAKASNILLTTPAASSNDVTPATTQYVTTALANLADSAPSTLNTLNELAAALGDDANFSTTVTNSIATKLPLAGGTMTGNLIIDPSAAGAAVLGLERTGAANQWKIAQGHTATDYLEILEGSNVRLTIKNGGNVGIGTTSPDFPLEIAHATPEINLYDTSSSAHFRMTLDGVNTSIQNKGTSGVLTFTTTNSSSSESERMRIDADGNVGIGTTTPTSYSAYADNLVVAGAGETGITIASGNSSQSGVYFADGTSGNEQYRGYLDYNHSSDKMSIGTAGVTRSTMLGGGRTAWSANAVGDVTTVPRDFAFYTEGSTNGMEIRSNDQRLVFMGAGGSSGTGSDDGYLAMSSQGTGKIALNANGVSYINGGNFGVGEADPHEKMHITGASGVALLVHMDADTGGGETSVLFKADSTNDDRRIKAGIIYKRDNPGTRGTGVLHFCVNGVNSDTNVSTSDSRLKITESGHVQIPQYLAIGGDKGSNASDSITVNGAGYRQWYMWNSGAYFTNGSNEANLSSGGSWNNASDERYKENIVDIPYGTAELLQLKPRKYNMKEGGEVQIGLIAQEVETIIPEVVEDSETGYKSMSYSNLNALLIKTIQELEARIKVLEG